MPAALTRAFGQLGDPAILKILWIAVAAAILLIGLLTGGVVWALTSVEIPGFGWLSSLLQVLGGLAAFVVSLFLFPGVVGLVSSLFLDQVAGAVERRYYPGLGPARRQGLGEAIGTALRFLGVLLVFNLMALIVSLLVPPFSLFVFYAVNGYLLGREYFEMVALRRMDPAAAAALRRRFGGRVLLGGVTIAVLISIPVLNLLVPVVATAFMVHVHRGLLARA
ncbi:MAG: hypothetical protein HKM95_11030 [Inquilinus sp.]|nr:hypothetical protein [Inquilinus sp.]